MEPTRRFGNAAAVVLLLVSLWLAGCATALVADVLVAAVTPTPVQAIAIAAAETSSLFIMNSNL